MSVQWAGHIQIGGGSLLPPKKGGACYSPSQKTKILILYKLNLNQIFYYYFQSWNNFCEKIRFLPLYKQKKGEYVA